MSYDDFIKQFNKIYIGVNFPDNWSGIRFLGYWHNGLQNCGGVPSKNG